MLRELCAFSLSFSLSPPSPFLPLPPPLPPPTRRRNGVDLAYRRTTNGIDRELIVPVSLLDNGRSLSGDASANRISKIKIEHGRGAKWNSPSRVPFSLETFSLEECISPFRSVVLLIRDIIQSEYGSSPLPPRFPFAVLGSVSD